MSYGSHWRFHWLSTLWFGLAASVAAWAGARLFGRSLPSAGSGKALVVAAWSYFVALTIVFGVSVEPFVDPRFIGHQAREILTHGLVTLPLGLGLLAIVEGAVARSDPRLSGPRPSPVRIAGVFAIPIFLAIGVLAADAMAAGQTEGGLAAMVAAHFFEHVLDYVLVGLLVVGGHAFRLGYGSFVVARWAGHRAASPS
ncbi:MAG TPA: hypothetical protein VMM79_20695 [Longimicrobiales bacterium]|nr:hypothetical protein [Longimicrobiales bacterium]